MADKLRLYVPCPVCSGSGQICAGVSSPNQPQGFDFKPCPTCLNESPPFGAKIFDGIRHVYYGRFEEVQDE